MTIVVKLHRIINAQRAFQELIAYKPKGKFGYDAAKLVNKCNAEVEAFNKARQVSVEAYGVLDERTGNYNFPLKEKQDAFKNDVASLLDMDITLEVSQLAFIEVEELDPSIGLWAGLDWAIAEPAV